MTDLAQLSNPKTLRRRIRRKLRERWLRQGGFSRHQDHGRGDSAVLLLLGRAWNGTGFGQEVGIFLNKRSAQVRQPGDICCPGGGLDPYKDRLLARILALPGMPFGIHAWRAGNSGGGIQRGVALALATALRESWEEMRLNPLRFSFLGPLPAECLSLFKRRIYPLVGWSRKQKAFRPNWEVAAVPFIPLRNLLEPRNYVCLRLSQATDVQGLRDRLPKTFTGFRFDYNGREEILWGATFRIVTRFLDLTFGFQAPPRQRLPLRNRSMAANYLGAG